MKIINELAGSAIKNNRKDTLATRLSVLLAVALLGAVVFIISSLKEEQYNFIVETTGDYHISISEINGKMYDALTRNPDIRRISFDRHIETEAGAVICEKNADSWKTEAFEPDSGRKPSAPGELMVPARFLNGRSPLQIGSELKVNNKNYIIVGAYDDYGYSFEDFIFLGYSDSAKKEDLFRDGAGVQAYLWYKSPRDTYRLTEEIMKKFRIDRREAESTGRLFYNREILEYKMIYPAGLIPPAKVLADAAETYGGCLLLAGLFAVMIYGAFNVWNNRDLKEIALLKSVGMTNRQVRKMVRRKVLKLSVLPIAAGTAASYLISNLLLWLMWLNNSITYNKISDLFGDGMRAPDFRFITPSPAAFLLIVILSFLTVYLSALLPARQSAKLPVIEGLQGNAGKNVRGGASKIGGKPEVSLARDYFKAYRSAYRTILLSMILSAMALNGVLVSQAYRELKNEYGFDSPFHFTSRIHAESAPDSGMIREIGSVPGVDEWHFFSHKDFKIFPEDNRGFVSEELESLFKAGKKYEEDLYVRIYGLSDGDFENLLSESGSDGGAAYLLLNATPDSNEAPYMLRKYIPAADTGKKEVTLRYSAGGKKMQIPIDGYLETFPYNLDAHGNNGIHIFTRMSSLERFIAENGNDEADPVNHYTVQIRSERDLAAVADQCEKIISSYVPKPDYSTVTDLLEAATEKEQLRNEYLFNTGIQIILLIIALSNAYNSFYGNLRARKRDFQLLFTAGMTEKQMKKMVFFEGGILFMRIFAVYAAVFLCAVAARACRSSFDFGFAAGKLIRNIEPGPVVLIFAIMAAGIFLSVRGSIKNMINEEPGSVLREV